MQFHLFNLVCGAAAMLALPAAALGVVDWAKEPRDLQSAQTAAIAPGAMEYSQPGEFLVNGRPVAAPAERIVFERPFEMMAYLVSLGDYRRCVADGACKPADASEASADTVPVTGVSYLDAVAYAGWFSKKTGETWRLPTDAEWAFAAAERYVGDNFIEANDPANPAVAWIRRYREETERKRVRDPEPKPAGFYGPNSRGLYDLGGNVWEWTSTCYFRATLTPDGKFVQSVVENCGVHVMEGRHRAYMSNFIRDGKSGGCAVGTPPENLGFRLVRERPPLMSLAGMRRHVRAAIDAAN